jgi:hypothetical protein
MCTVICARSHPHSPLSLVSKETYYSVKRPIPHHYSLPSLSLSALPHIYIYICTYYTYIYIYIHMCNIIIYRCICIYVCICVYMYYICMYIGRWHLRHAGRARRQAPEGDVYVCTCLWVYVACTYTYCVCMMMWHNVWWCDTMLDVRTRTGCTYTYCVCMMM